MATNAQKKINPNYKPTDFKTRASLDLSALNTSKAEIILPDGTKDTFDVPTVQQLLSLSEIGDMLQNIDEENPKEASAALKQFSDKIIEFVPPLAPFDLNLDQQMATLEFLLKIAMPEDDQTAPPKKGTPQDHKKKAAPKAKKKPTAKAR